MIIVNLNKKGGVGKTTNTLHVASYLAFLGKKVLLIDADNQCDLSWSVGIKDTQAVYNILDFLTENKNKELEFQSNQENLFILPGAEDFEASKFDKFILRKKIDKFEISNLFDYIFIDVPPAGVNKFVVTPAEIALCCSDYFLCTIRADVYSVKNLNSFLGNVFLLKANENLNLKFLGVYFSDVNTQKFIFRYFREEIEKEAEDILFDSYIRSDAEVEKAAANGKTIFQYNPSCRAAYDYKKLTKEIERRIQQKNI